MYKENQRKLIQNIYLGKDTAGVGFLFVCARTGEGAGQDSFLFVSKNIEMCETFNISTWLQLNKLFQTLERKEDTSNTNICVFIFISTQYSSIIQGQWLYRPPFKRKDSLHMIKHNTSKSDLSSVGLVLSTAGEVAATGADIFRRGGAE